MEERIKNLIIAVAGEELLGYMLNCDSSDVHCELDKASEELLPVLVACSLDDAVSLIATGPKQRVPSAFGNPVDTDQTVANWAHAKSGGTASEIPAENDWFADAMARCMLRMHPFIRAELHRRGNIGMSPLLGGLAILPPPNLAASFWTDASVVEMSERFDINSEAIDDLNDHRLLMYPSFGAAGTVDFRALALALLEASVLEADSRCVLNDEDACAKIAIAVTKEFRGFLAGEEAFARVRVLLGNVSFSDERSIEIEHGVIRSPTDYELGLLFGMESTSALVCDLHVPCKLVKAEAYKIGVGAIGLDEDEGTKALFARNAERWMRLLDEVLRVQVAAILALAEGEVVSPTNCAMLANNLILCASGYSSEPLKAASEWSARCCAIDSEAFGEWYQLLDGAHLPELAMKRLVSAFEDEKSKEDSTIELLIVLESLLGEQGEIAFKLSAAVAKLLAPDDLDKREEVYSQMKKAYNLRSKIVHGDERELEKLRPSVEAIRIDLSKAVLDVAKTLLTSRRDLLDLSPGDRLKHVLLG